MIAVIGGTGFGALAGLKDATTEDIQTPYGEAHIETGQFAGQQVVFIPRHGNPPRFPPHKINYRANVKALEMLGIDNIIAVTAVGSVDPVLAVGDFIVPDQIIDYTYGREQTYFDREIGHVDFTYPYSTRIRAALIEALGNNPDCHLYDTGTYGCTQGPRLESAAEIHRMYVDGCSIVGMTAMPEAALARELGIDYGGVSVVVNKGAGLDPEPLDLAVIEANLHQSMEKLANVLVEVVQTLSQASN